MSRDFIRFIEALASELDRLRDRKGRLFLIGVGGRAANCSHAINREGMPVGEPCECHGPAEAFSGSTQEERWYRDDTAAGGVEP